MTYCLKCGYELIDEPLYCPNCGERTEFVRKNKPKEQNVNESSLQEYLKNKEKIRVKTLAENQYNGFVLEIFLYRQDDPHGVFPHYYVIHEGDVFYEDIPFLQNPSVLQKRSSPGRILTISGLLQTRAEILIGNGEKEADTRRILKYGEACQFYSLMKVMDGRTSMYDITILDNRKQAVSDR